ncbi:lytic polysaccharide monooxygenase [Streptomyces sp. NPDC020141]|uniref:lytic polysaccharide monooxygenase n=1 Tax=Streptomyces sp. NPDC020141 TaxID=3365065 RepID=UPI0037B2FAC0
MMIDPRTATTLALRCAAVIAVPVLFATAVPWTAHAHGAPVDPMSRAAACGATEAAKNSTACRAALAANGGLTFDAWDKVGVAGVQGRDRELIPDGQLCSAGLDAYRGLDITHAEWPTTQLTSGESFTLEYRSTVEHPGRFDLYLTKAGYDPSKALRWADLESEPFASVKDPEAKDGVYRIGGTIPQDLTGPHVLYTVWRNTDTQDTYYSCSDVVLTSETPETGSFGLYGKQSPVSALDTPSAAADSKPSARAEAVVDSGNGVSFKMIAGGFAALALLVLGALATLRPPGRAQGDGYDDDGRGGYGGPGGHGGHGGPGGHGGGHDGGPGHGHRHRR